MRVESLTVNSSLFSWGSLNFDRSVNVFCTHSCVSFAALNWLLTEKLRTGEHSEEGAGEGEEEAKETEDRRQR